MTDFQMEMYILMLMSGRNDEAVAFFKMCKEQEAKQEAGIDSKDIPHGAGEELQ